MATTTDNHKIKAHKLKDVFVMKPKEFNMQFMTEKASEKTFSTVSPSKHA